MLWKGLPMRWPVVLIPRLACAMALGALVHSQPASAVTMQECSTKYKAAQTAGTLGTMTWNEFRKAQCGSTVTGPASTGATSTPPLQKRPDITAKPSAPVPTGGAAFPSAIASKYSSESPGKARMHTCLDQYKANEAAGGSSNGGLKWIQKGGGYYSQCNAHLRS